MGEEKGEMMGIDGCKHMPHLTSAGTPAPSGERHVDDKGGRLGRRSQLEFEPLRRGLRNRSLPLVCTRSYDEHLLMWRRAFVHWKL